MSIDHREKYACGELPITLDEQDQMVQDLVTLICDMSENGATMREILQVVEHSTVVIDARKHNLNVEQSAEDHDIEALRAKYTPIKEDA